MNYNIIHQYEMLKEQEIIEQKKTEKLNQNKNNMCWQYICWWNWKNIFKFKN